MTSVAFPKQYAEFVARTRVTAGFLVAAAFLWLATPCAISLSIGGAVGLLGVAIRAWAAGHLEKNQRLASSGPYRHTRNPLYVGTLTTGVGFAIAGAHLGIGIAMVAFFLLWYLPVVEEEESHLRKILPGYREYERKVPRIIPSLTPRVDGGRPFRWEIYRRNREYQAFLGYLAVMAVLAAKLLL